MSYIHIVPIFNQRAPLIWSTFTAIQRAAMWSAYKYKMHDHEMAANITMLNTAWHREACYAFAAYDECNKMVGCLYGYMGVPYASVSGLYVLPKYKKQGIGTQLLASAEQSASLYADMMRLTAVWQARNFYQARKYHVVSAREGLHEKSINVPGPINAVIPIFACSNNVAMQCDNIAKADDLSFDASAVNTKHLPMFAHINAEKKIDGYILAAPYNSDTDVRVSQLCLSNPERHDIACRLIESMAAMNIR